MVGVGVFKVDDVSWIWVLLIGSILVMARTIGVSDGMMYGAGLQRVYGSSMRFRQ